VLLSIKDLSDGPPIAPEIPPRTAALRVLLEAKYSGKLERHSAKVPSI
jgi:hypothetical protein